REGRRGDVRGPARGPRPHDAGLGAARGGLHGHHRRVRLGNPAPAPVHPRRARLPAGVPARGPGVMAPGPDAGMIRVPDPADRDDLRTLLRRILRLDEAAVVRLTSGAGGRMRVWARTPFGALVVRGLGGDCPGGDVVAGADHLLTELDVLPRGDIDGRIDPGMPLLS